MQNKIDRIKNVIEMQRDMSTFSCRNIKINMQRSLKYLKENLKKERN